MPPLEEAVMPNFAFKERNRQGETLLGERMADSRQALALTLRREQIFLLEAQEKKAGRKSFEFGGNPTPKDIAVFTRQFSVMIDAGVPLVQCIELLASKQANKKFATALKAVQTEVESGNSLAASMKNHQRIFDDLYTNMVAAGEAGGILDTIFQRLSVYIEKNVKLKRAVQSAMVYPIAVVVIASGVPILDCLDITARTSGNAIIEEAILNVKKAISEGRTIVDPLKESGVFPSMVVSMIGVGEQAGALETMLTKIATFYEEEVDAAVGDLMTALEPMIIVILGTTVGGIVISMYMPIFTLVGQLSK